MEECCVGFTLFKLYKWYKFVQRITIIYTISKVHAQQQTFFHLKLLRMLYTLILVGHCNFKKMDSNQDYIEDWIYKTLRLHGPNEIGWEIGKMFRKNYLKLNILENCAILVVFQLSFYFSPINICLIDFSNNKQI